ncbi:MAG TPA: septum formation initiator family protein [Candidatus Manganitrophaceae bacterium]|nr:septum formation initiator family protein [Candidatus Manganitrophaceae bacterium]
MKNRSKGAADLSRRKRRRLFLGVAFFLSGYLLLSFLFGEMGMVNSLKMKRTYAQIQEEILSLKRENEALTHKIEALKSDPHYIESLARNQLGMAKEGELIYEFYDPSRR